MAADVPYPDIIATLFPAGNGFAVDKGAQTEFYLSAPQDPGTADALNVGIDDRYDLRGDYVDTIKVARIGGAQGNLLAHGQPFLMLVGRNQCTSGDDRLLLDVIAVSFVSN